MSSLPHDLMTEIMLHLPAKSLMRFKCVCKPWYSQISDSEFLVKYLIGSMGNENPNFFLLTDPFNPQIHEGPFKPFEQPQPIPSGDRHGYFLELESNSFDKAVKIEIPQSQNIFMLPPKVIGYCNELVCLKLSNHVYLLNPFTKNYNKYELDVSVGVGYSSRSLYGFGYDFVEKVYILVEITMPQGSSRSRIQSFSLSDSDSLSLSSSITTPYRVLNKLECVRGEELGHYVDGSLYWLARVENGATVNDDSTDTVISYDIGKKVAAEVPLPDSVCQQHYINLGILAGKLSMVCKSCKSDTEVWVMMDSCGARNSWCKLFSIGRKIFSFRYFCWTRPLFLTKNGGIILKDGRDLVLYDPKQNAVRNLKIQDLKDGMILSEIVPLVVGNANV